MVCCFAQKLHAQSLKNLYQRADSFLSMRYERADIDTAYIIRPSTKWAILGRFNVAGAAIAAEGLKDQQQIKTDMMADFKKTITAGVSYRGLSLNLSLNPAKLLGRYDDYEVNFKSYGRKFGIDIAYQDAHNYHGWQEVDGQNGPTRSALPEDALKLKTLNVNTYYVFNNRRFSYPAAFAHSYIQRRSAGSFLLALSGQAQKGITDDDEPFEFSMTNIGIGAGYGYNYVPGKSWLLHLSSLPTMVVYSNTSVRYDDVKTSLEYDFPEVIITTRIAVVKQLGKYFTGLSFVHSYTGIGNDKSLSVHNFKWLLRAYVGYRF